MKKISVVIPTYNGGKDLITCIKSLQIQTLVPREIIVVDNASTDETLVLLKKSCKNIKIIKNDKNYGVSLGRNIGLKEVGIDSEAVLFFDHDMRADRNLILRLSQGFKKNSVGIATPKIYYESDHSKIWAAGTGIDLSNGHVFFRCGVDIGQFESDSMVQVAPAALMVKMSLIRKIGGFSQKYFATFEDTDFCFKAKTFGYDTWYIHKAIAWHSISVSKKSEADRLLVRAFQVAKNRIIFMAEYGNNPINFYIHLPLYFVYYAAMSIKYHRPAVIFDYIRGIISGLASVLTIPFSYKWILKKALGENIGAVLDIGCGDGELLSSLLKNSVGSVDGVELYDKSIFKASISGRYLKVFKCDVVNLSRSIIPKYDIVFSSQVLEHIEKSEALSALKSWEAKSIGKVVVTSTNGFFSYEPLQDSDIFENELQTHKSGWSVSEFNSLGYKVRGQGARWIYGPNGLSKKFASPILVWEILNLATSPLVYFLPSLGTYLIATKDK